MMPFEFEATDLPGLTLVLAGRFEDQRGAFWEMYQDSAFEDYGLPANFQQLNLSQSNRKVLRGLHFQLQPHAQGKLIAVLRGEIYDVAVDLRRGSPTYQSWLSFQLSDSPRRMIYIPEGFAHGFQVLSESALVSYQCTAKYAPKFEAGIRWDDPRLGIPWPMEDPILSEKDRGWPGVHQVKHNFVYSGGSQ